MIERTVPVANRERVANRTRDVDLRARCRVDEWMTGPGTVKSFTLS